MRVDLGLGSVRGIRSHDIASDRRLICCVTGQSRGHKHAQKPSTAPGYLVAPTSCQQSQTSKIPVARPQAQTARLKKVPSTVPPAVTSSHFEAHSHCFLRNLYMLRMTFLLQDFRARQDAQDPPHRAPDPVLRHIHCRILQASIFCVFLLLYVRRVGLIALCCCWCRSCVRYWCTLDCSPFETTRSFLITRWLFTTT